MRDLHTLAGWVAIFANAAVGLWAAAAHWLEALRHRTLWWAVAVAQLTLFVVVTFGVALLSEIEGDPDQFHTFYGFLTLIGVAILYGYRNQVPQWRYLLYGGGSLFIAGLAIRAMFLDPAGVGVP